MGRIRYIKEINRDVVCLSIHHDVLQLLQSAFLLASPVFKRAGLIAVCAGSACEIVASPTQRDRENHVDTTD